MSFFIWVSILCAVRDSPFGSDSELSPLIDCRETLPTLLFHTPGVRRRSVELVGVR